MTALSTPSPASDNLGLDELRELMRSVNETAEQLQSTHTALHRQVARLQNELAEANARLRRSRALAALGEMAAGIAHEIRNPLGSIQLYAQVLGEDLKDRPEASDVCGKIGRAVESLDAIVADVLRFARDAELRPEPVRPRVLLDRALEASEALVQRAGVEIEWGAVASLTLQADVSLMTQALGNLVRNAVQAMELVEGPRRLGLAAEDRALRSPDGRRVAGVVLGIADTGPGIPEAARARMFNPFFTTRAAGTGLGLAIVHRIVDAHGGQVSAENRPAGGAKVELCLPIQPFTPEGDS